MNWAYVVRRSGTNRPPVSSQTRKAESSSPVEGEQHWEGAAKGSPGVPRWPVQNISRGIVEPGLLEIKVSRKRSVGTFCARLCPCPNSLGGADISTASDHVAGRSRTALPYQRHSSNASSTSSRSLVMRRSRLANARPTRYLTVLKCRTSSSAASL